MLLIGPLSLAAAVLVLWLEHAAAFGAPGRGALAFCAMMVGIEPRRHRPYSLPVIATASASAALAAAHSLWGLAALDAGIAAMSVVLSEQARRSVSGALLRGGPPIG
jgi:hypothetical protein